MSYTSLFVFRHGETDWNLEKRFQGHTDIALNKTGLQQAEGLAKKLETLQPEAIVTSDLLRAKTTALICNQKLGVPINETPSLRECRLGDPEGMLLDEIIQTFGQAAWERWRSVAKEDLEFHFPNGESKSVHLARMTRYLEDFCLENVNLKRIAVSTHGASMRRLVHHCEGAPSEPVAMPNCALYHLLFYHESRRWVFNKE